MHGLSAELASRLKALTSTWRGLEDQLEALALEVGRALLVDESYDEATPGFRYGETCGFHGDAIERWWPLDADDIPEHLAYLAGYAKGWDEDDGWDDSLPAPDPVGSEALTVPAG